MTAAEVPVTMAFAAARVAPGNVQRMSLLGVDSARGPYYICYSPAQMVTSLVREVRTEILVTTSNACASDADCRVSLSASYDSSCFRPFAQGSFSIGR
jgi:hypothetical protein